MIQEGHVGRLQQLFTPDGHGALSHFYVTNKIVSNPSAMVDILRDFPQLSTIDQEKVLEKVNLILEQVTTNSYALNKNQDPAILDLVIDLIPNYVDNYVIFNKLLAFLDSLLKTSATDQRSVQKCIKKLIIEYYTLNGNVDSKHLFGIISILKCFFICKISLDKQPQKMIVFHGENGLEIRPSSKKEMNWLFGNGMSIYFWINIENINFGRESLPKLFTFYSPGKGGIQSYLSNNKIYYRIIGEKYSEPKSDSNGLCLGELEPRKWHFIGIEQEAKKGLGGILGGRSLIFHLNGNKFSFSLTPNSISSKEKMKMVFFDKIYCRTSSICVIPEQMQDTFSEALNKNKNSIDLIKYPKALIFEERQGKLYERSDLGFCPDPILHRHKQMSFQNIIPLFHMHKFATKDSQFPILNQLLSLFVLFLYKSPQNQLEAYKNNYLHIMKELVKELPNLGEVFNDETINTLLHIKQTITNTDLLVQYHGQFLWGFVDSKISISCKQMLLQIVKNNFTQNISYFSNVIGLDQMINLIEKLNVKTNRCCEKHYKIMLSRFEKDILDENQGNHFGENELALDYVAKIIELYIQNQKVSPEKEIYKLCRVLSNKFSPCFTLSFMGVIKRVLGGKLNEKLSSSHSKKMIEELMNKKVYLIFLHVIENSFFAEIKAQCVRIVYSLLLRRSTIADQQQISYRLSKALWKINEDVQGDAKISSHHTSPEKIKQIQEIREQQSPKFQLAKKVSAKGKVLMRISSLNSDDNDSVEKSSSNGSKNKATSIFKQVGPQAPQLSNRTKMGKKFTFGFMSESNIEEEETDNKKKSGSTKQIETVPFQSFDEKKKDGMEVSDNDLGYQQEIMEEQKTNENDVVHCQQKDQIEDEIELTMPKPKGKSKIKSLSINIDSINEIYTFGGEKGQQIIISQQQKDAQIMKIRKLAKICVAAMRGERVETKEEQVLENKPFKQYIPPMTTSNKALKSREQPKLQQLKLIDEEEESQSAVKVPKSIKPINTSIPSPNFGSRKSKSPTSMNSINQQNLMILYNSLMENCISIPNYDLVTPSIMYVFFSWIPETNFETKFLLDLSLILENDESRDKIRLFSKMPEFYDFLFQLAYKALLFEEMGEKRVYVEKLEEIIKKIFAFIFREDPQCHDKFIFIMQWCSNKVKEYHPKCVFLTSRYIYFLIIDSIEQDIGNNSRNDKLMERNFQTFGAIILKFCQFFPKQSQAECGYDVFEDEFKRVTFKPEFEMISSMAPYFTSAWVDYLLCYKYFLLFQKYFCTQWYRKSERIFEKYLETGNVEILEHFISVSLTQQWLALNAEQVFYLKNSLIFTLMGITKFMLIQKTLTKQNECSQEANMILQTILVVLFAESNKQKNDKLNSDIVNAFIKNCQTFCQLKTEKAAIVIHLLTFIKQTALKNSFVNASSVFENNSMVIRQPKNSQGILRSTPFIDKLMADFMQEGLFKGSDKVMDLQSFRLLFQDVTPPKQGTFKIKSQYFNKFISKGKQIQNKAQLYIEKLSEIMEQQTERFFSTEVLIEASDRQARSLFRKMWKNLRVFGSPWTHPEMKLQNNILFTKRLISYEHMEQNTFYKWRIAKQLSKYRARYLLKPILYEPGSEHNSQNLDDSDHFQQKLQIGLHKALMYFAKNELLLGTRILSWLAPKTSLSGSQNKQIRVIENKQLEFKRVKLIKTLTVRSGYLSIINDKLVFINSYFKEPASHLSIAEYKLQQNKQYAKVWQLDMLKEIHKRRYVNRRRALEISFIYGKSVMFDFESTSQLDDFVKKIIKLKGKECPNLIFNGNKSLDPKKDYEALGLLKRWSTYEISNFEYLMEINNLAGRSYSDLTQYPVFPWVVVNFGNQFAFNDESSYRNLALPMGALGSEKRTEGFRQRYENMSQIQEERFNYGTHYSSPAIIYHFMVRLSPFTEGSVLLQSGKFDFADRLFFSVADSYKNATSQYSDVRQLIPQMFTLPQVYLNFNKLDLGVMQSQMRVHNVELPLWARDNPYLYVTKLRKAFEQLSVSKNINKWIDLIFGFKQRGEEAVRNMNCFVHLTYEDSINFEQMQDEKTAQAIETQVLNFGQTPSQLFTKPHQERTSLSALQIPCTICDSNVEARIYRPSKHQKNSDLLKDADKQDFNIMKQQAESIVHMRWFKESKLVFIRKNGQMLFYKWHTAQPGANKVPFQCAIQKQKLISRISRNMPESIQYFDPSLKTDTFPLQFLNNGSHIALGGISDGKLLIVDTDTNLVIESHSGHSHTICCVQADLKDNFLITGDISGHVIVWRILPNSPKHLVFYNQMKDHSKQITSVCISYDIRCLFTSSLDGSVFAYNIITGKKVKVFYHPELLPVSAVIVSTNPLPVVVLFSNQESMIYCYSINGQLIQRVRQKDMQHFLSPILIKDSYGFQHVAYGNNHGNTIFRKLPFLDNIVSHVVAKEAAVNRMCLSKNSRFVIVGCSDGQLSVITAPDLNTK